MRISIPISLASISALTLLACDPAAPTTTVATTSALAAKPAPAAPAKPLTRIPAPGDSVYDISIGNVIATNIFHADHPNGAPNYDDDYVYFSLVDKDSSGNIVFQGNFNDGANHLGALTEGASTSGGHFVIPQVPLQPGDTLYIAYTIDSRTAVASLVAPWQQNEVSFVAQRALSFATGSKTDTESLPFSTDNPNPPPTDGNNFPIWIQNAGLQYPLPQLNPALTSQGVQQCDGYVAEGFLQIPAATIIGVSQNVAAPTQFITDTKDSDSSIACYEATNAWVANAAAKTSISFNAYWSKIPPNLGGSICNVNGANPIMVSSAQLGTPDDRFAGQWRDPNDNVEAWVGVDNVSGYDATTTEWEDVCATGARFGTNATASASRTNMDGDFYTAFTGQVGPPCFRFIRVPPIPLSPSVQPEARTEEAPAQPSDAAKPDLTIIPIRLFWAEALELSNYVHLELYQETCSNPGGVGGYQIRYKRFDASGNLITDIMLNPYLIPPK